MSQKTIIISLLIMVIFLSLLVKLTKSSAIYCEKSAIYGDIEVCLPEIEGRTECYAEFKEGLDELEMDMNTIIAFYITDSTYLKLKDQPEDEMLWFDDYFQVFGTKEARGMKVSKEFIDEGKSFLSNNYDKIFETIPYDQINEKINSLTMDSVNIGVPVLLQEYQLNDYSFCFVLFSRLQLLLEEKELITYMNGLIVQDRFIFSGYYKYFTDIHSIEEGKAENDKFVQLLMEENGYKSKEKRGN